MIDLSRMTDQHFEDDQPPNDSFEYIPQTLIYLCSILEDRESKQN